MPRTPEQDRAYQAEYRRRPEVRERRGLGPIRDTPSPEPQGQAAWSRRSYLKRKHGLTVQQYEAMLASQDGVCAICKGACPTGYRLAVDHCHETGKIRGLLCVNCNQGLGHFRDSIPRLQAAIDYLS